MVGRKGKECSQWNLLHKANSPPWSYWSISVSSLFPFNPQSHWVHFRCGDVLRCMSRGNQLAESLGSFQVCFSMYATHSGLAEKICFSTSVILLLCPAEGKYLGQLKCWSNTGVIHAVLFRRWRQGEESKDNLVFSKEAALACLCFSLCKGVCDAWEKQAQRPSLWRDKHPYFNLRWFSP